MSYSMNAAFLGFKAHFIEVESGTFIGRAAAARGYLDYPLAPETLEQPTHLQVIVLRAHRIVTKRRN